MHVCILFLGLNSGSIIVSDSGPRLLYTERNFGELEFIENPLQLVLFQSTKEIPRGEVWRQEYLQRLSKGNSTWGVQLRRVREKIEAMRRLYRQLQQKRALGFHRQLTRDQASKFRSRLEAYKEHRERLLNELISRPAQELPIVGRITALSREFEAFTETVLGGNAIFFSRLLQLHSALLLAHACDGEDVGHSGNRSSSRSHLLFSSCSLLTPWESIVRPPDVESFVNATLRRLWDRIFDLTSRREAFGRALPFGDVAVLRLSAAADQLVRMAATARAAGIARLAESRRLLPSKLITSRLREHEWLHLTRTKRNRTDGRMHLLDVLSAASDRLLRQACLQLQSPRRQQQREEVEQLFQRGVASQPADPSVFADLGSNLHMVCSLVNIPALSHPSKLPPTRSTAPNAAYVAVNHMAGAVADSWVLVELLETKTWILSRTFDAVTGRLAKEKLLSSFASEQRQQQLGIGQWTCQGWKGPSESQMYLCHLCILGASLLVLGAIILIAVVTLFFAFRATMLVLASLVQHRRSCIGEYRSSSSGGQHRKPPLRGKILTPMGAALAGGFMTMKSGAVVSPLA